MPKVSQMLESKYLKKDDVGEEGTVCTVKAFARTNVAQEGEPPEHKWLMAFEELEKPMVLNSTNIQLCEKIFGSDDTDDWIGKRLIVYSDPNISFGGKIVGGIRVRKHSNGQPRRPAGDDFDTIDTPDAALVEHKRLEIRSASMNGTAALRRAWEGLSDSMRDALRPELGAFKSAAAQADAAPKGDAFEDDVPM